MLITLLNFLHDVQILKLQLNNIKHVCKSNFPKHLKMLDISYNLVYGIRSQCFSDLLYLNSLILQQNQISHLSSKAFFQIISLKFLDISNNPLTYLPSYSFTSLPCIKLIIFTNINFNYIDVDVFVNMYPKIIITSHYGISCFIQDRTKCIYSSAFQLNNFCMGIVPKGLYKNFLCIIPLMIIVVNIVAGILHFYDAKLNMAFKITIIVIDFHHELYGIYLCMIWIYDTMVGDTFVNDEVWRSHSLCFLASWTILCFEIMDQFLILFFINF